MHESTFQYLKPTKPTKSPSRWRVKDYADGWIYFQLEDTARYVAKETNALLQWWNGANWIDV